MSAVQSPTLGGIAYVTGGGRGLGHAVAAAFARAGCSGVTIIDVLPAAELEAAKRGIEELGAKCLAISCDVSKEDQVQDSIAKTVEAFGRLDYAANFAGISGPPVPVTETDAEALERCLRVNTVGVFLCTKHQIIQMMKQTPLDIANGVFRQRGAIVNCASVNSVLGGASTTAYTASKHAVVGITKTAALEARAHDIRVNALSPGFIWTPMVAAGMTNHGNEQMRTVWEKHEARQGRKAMPDEIGGATVLLCSPLMSLVNAHNLVCDNGFVMNENPF